MNKITSGVHIYVNNIDTDQIYRGYYLELTDHEKIVRLGWNYDF